MVKKPTPQRAPTFNALARRRSDFLVVYLTADTTKHGWGSLELHHPHVFVDDSWRAALALAAKLWLRPSVRVVALFGYRGPVHLAAAVCSRFLGRPMVTRSDSNFERVTGESRARQITRKLAVRVVLPRRTWVWTIGEANDKYWRDYLGYPRCIRIPYEVPVLPNSAGAGPTDRTTDPISVRVLFVGRLERGKRVLDLIAAFRGLPSSADGWHLDIVGDGPHREHVVTAAEKDPRIHLHGAVEYERLDSFYRVADVLVLPSSQEAWGLVVNEALGFGLWVVVSDQVGAKELLTSPERGAIYPVGDVEGLRDCLSQIVRFRRRTPVPASTDTADLMAKELRHLTGS